MPVRAGMHFGFRELEENLDSGPGSGPGQALRRNDERETAAIMRVEFLKATFFF